MNLLQYQGRTQPLLPASIPSGWFPVYPSNTQLRRKTIDHGGLAVRGLAPQQLSWESRFDDGLMTRKKFINSGQTRNLTEIQQSNEIIYPVYPSGTVRRINVIAETTFNCIFIPLSPSPTPTPTSLPGPSDGVNDKRKEWNNLALWLLLMDEP